MKKIILVAALALVLACPALAQPVTTQPNISNLLTQCSPNTPVVGNGASTSPICHASGALGSAAFANTGTGVATALAIATNGAGGFPTYTAGTWTPTVTTTSTVGTPAYSTQVGTYEQIGRDIVVRFTLVLSGWTGSPTGTVNIAGLPLTSANVANDNGSCQFGSYVVTGLTASNILTGVVNFNTSTIQLIQIGNTTGALVTAAQIGTTPTFIGMCNYHT